jgi:hypothetical protein
MILVPLLQQIKNAEIRLNILNSAEIFFYLLKSELLRLPFGPENSSYILHIQCAGMYMYLKMNINLNLLTKSLHPLSIRLILCKKLIILTHILWGYL